MSGGARGANGYLLSYPSSSFSSSSHSLLPSLPPSRPGPGEKGGYGVEPATPAELRPPAPGPQPVSGAATGLSAESPPPPEPLPAPPCPHWASYLTMGTGPRAGSCPGQCPRGPQSSSGLERPRPWVLSVSLRRGVT